MNFETPSITPNDNVKPNKMHKLTNKQLFYDYLTQPFLTNFGN